MAHDERSGDAPLVWGGIPLRNPDFTGRAKLLKDLHERLLQDRAATLVPHTLHGMGGVGKTSLAVEYVYRSTAEYDLVWWISAERTAQISLSLVELARRLGLTPADDAASTVTAVLDSLRTGRPYRNWLLVYDNAESPEDLRPVLPVGGPGAVLVTSRNPRWAGIARPLEVDVFRREESRGLLCARSPGIGHDDAGRLAEALGDLPLAIEQAAAWHAETGMPVDEYLRLLDEKRVDVLRDTASPQAQHSVIAAWNISLEQLETKNPAAYQFLQVCSFYAPEPIPRALWERAPRSGITPELDAALADPLLSGRMIREIGRYSLARFDHRTNTLQMHRLVQAAVSSRMADGQRPVMRRAAHLLLAANDPNDPNNVRCWERYGSLHPHVVASEAVRSDDSRVRNLVVNEVVHLLRRGSYEASLDLARTAHKTWSDLLGPDHSQTLQLARWLGFVLLTMGSHREAAALNLATLEAYRRTSGPDAQDTVDTLGNVAIDHRARGDFAEALALSESAHAQYQRLLGPGHPEALRAAHNLGVSLRHVGEFARARDLDEQTWNGWTVVYGSDSIHTLLTWLGLIIDIRELGQYGTALTQLRRLMPLTESLLGHDNPISLFSLHQLAITLRKAGEHEEALEVAERAHVETVRRHGRHNRQSIVSGLELSVQLRQHGSLEDALALGTETWHRYEQTYGRPHPHTLSAAVSLALTYRRLGNAAAAQRIDTLALRGFAENLGETHPSTLVCRANLAGDHAALGNTAAARDLDTETLRRARELLGDDHPFTLGCTTNLALDHHVLGDFEEVLDLPGDVHGRVDFDIDPMPL